MLGLFTLEGLTWGESVGIGDFEVQVGEGAGLAWLKSSIGDEFVLHAMYIMLVLSDGGLHAL